MQQSEEARRYVLDRVMAGDLRASQAAEILGISERHAWRLLAAYRARGAAALGHGNRGRRPHNAVAADVASTVVRFATTRYPGANHTHLAELLWEHEGLGVSSWTVRRILARAGIASPRLEVLYRAHSQLSGPIPAELGNLTNLRDVRLNSNQLSGPIPAELGDLASLATLLLGGNRLSGPIPAELGNLTNLTPNPRTARLTGEGRGV